MPDAPQIYLLTPPEIDDAFPDRLARVMDGAEIGCLRLASASRDEDRVIRAADALRPVAHGRDVALVIEDHAAIAARLGLDGVHLTDGARAVRDVRAALEDDAVVGAFCGASRHDGLTAGERGADYVAFGPVGETALGHGEGPGEDLFAWWSEMIEVPIVAEGALDAAAVERLAPLVDWIALGEEIWRAEDPLAALREITAPLR
jgi:thiamine-phosphate pyrophosphorylase